MSSRSQFKIQSPKLKTLLVVVCYAALAVVLLRDGLFGDRIFWQDDTFTFYVPFLKAVSDGYHQGQFPLWTPLIYTGYPIFADGEAGMLYPPHLLLLPFLPLDKALPLLMALRLVLAATGLYAFARALGIGRFGAALGGLVYGFGGFSAAEMIHLNLAASMAWTPWLLAGGERAAQGWEKTGGSWRAFAPPLVGAGLALASQSLTMHTHMALMSGLALIAYILFRASALPTGGPRPRRGAKRLGLAVGALAIIGLVGVVLAAAQLLPLAELGALSRRGEGLDRSLALVNSLPPLNLITYLFPWFFNDGPGNYWGLWVQFETTLYVGLLPLALAVLAVIVRRTRLTWLCLGLIAVCLLLALGRYTPLPLFDALRSLPGLGWLRSPGRFGWGMMLGLAILAALGADWLRDGQTDRLTGYRWASFRLRSANLPSAICHSVTWPRSARRWLVGLVGLAVALPPLLAGLRWALDVRPEWTVGFLRLVWYHAAGADRPLSDEHHALLLRSLDPRTPETAIALVLLGLVALLLLAAYRGWLPRPLWTGAALGLVALDLLLFAGRLHPTAAWSTLTPDTAAANYLAANLGDARSFTPSFSEKLPDIEPNRLMMRGLPDASGYSSLQPVRHALFTAAAAFEDPRLFDWLGVRYRPVRGPEGGPAPSAEKPPGPQYRAVFQDGDLTIFESASAWPRARLIPSARAAPDGDTALRELRAPGFDPARVALVEGDAANLPSAGEPAGRVLAVRDGPNQVTVDLETPSPALLLLDDAWYPGWRVRVDGREAPVLRADYLFRGVVVPAGARQVEFVFEPPLVAWGSVVSGIGWVLALGFLLVCWLTGRGQARSGDSSGVARGGSV